ncbi:MAG: C25 family cysteine peptidase [Ignavibacterium sp.]|jgi:hypothetical protein|nr:C25 family cysteine peptidase [Ignavibacterium sp.]
MIKYFCALFIILPLITFAQQTKVGVSGNSFLVSVDNYAPKFTDLKSENFIIRDYFEYTNPSEKVSYKLPSLNLYFAIPPNSLVSIGDLNFEADIQTKILPSLNPSVAFVDSGISYIKNDYSRLIDPQDQRPLIEIVNYFSFYEFYIVQIRVNNFRFNSESSSLEILKNIKFKVILSSNYQFLTDSPLKLVTDFDKAASKLIVNSNIAEQFRSTSYYLLPDTTGNWIDYNSTFLKLGVGKDGIYRITKSDLDFWGVPTSIIDPRTFKLYESGREIDILVRGQQDGIFNDNDFIELWGQRNYPKISYRAINQDDEEYNEYLNKYSDTTNYFLTWNSVQGKRIDTLSTALSSATDTLDYYSQLLHNEVQAQFQFCDADEIANQTPNWLKNKSWYWNYLITQQNFNFTLDNIYPNKNASIFFKIVSYASNISTNSHQVKLLLNNSVLDSNSIDRFKQVVMTGNLNSSNLLNGTNQIRLQNLPNGSSPNALITDWYDVEYPKYLNLINDSLYFKVANDVSAGLKIFKMGNATQVNYRIYKVKPRFQIINNYSVSSQHLFFADSVSPGDEYFVISNERSASPKYYYTKNFLNLRGITQQTDYISITHPKFLNGVQNYIQTISNLFNLTTSVYQVNDIFDEFSFGYPYPDAIRLFTNVLYENAQEPKPQYLTLIGDASYDYKYFLGSTGGKNYVPSYGNPVSDNWYTVWDLNAPPIPQIKVGRIPINETSNLDFYLAKIQNNESKPFNEWNKRYLLFSGGRSDVTGELELLKSANDSIVTKYIQPKPIAGKYTHFYKTRDPQSDFGPYTPEEFQAAISAGGLFISYIGHSGTATWDNSINSTNQLYNDVDRNPLISDFGCSTNKFAEPNIICFGERFLFNSTGQALGYVGNSSLGFQSTAITAPKYFYGEIFSDSLSEVGNAHLISKIELFNRSGTTSVNRIYALTNLILGDPVVRLKIPKLPNFKITSSDIRPTMQQIGEDLDSAEFKVSIKNLGLSPSGTLELNFVQLYDNIEIKSENRLISIPDYADTVSVWVVTKNKPGLHSLEIRLDPNSQIEEIYEDDNLTTFDFNVYSSSLRDLLTSVSENSSLQSLRLLNPANYNSNIFPIELQISDENSFSNSNSIIVTSDTFFTDINLGSINQSKRYFLRYKIDSQESTFSSTKSFFNEDSINYLLIDSLSFGNQDLTNVRWENDSLRILPDTASISVLSAGFNAGATCVISKNGINLLSNTFFAGMGIVVFDNITLDVDTSAWFQLFNQPANVEALATLIDSIPSGKIVAIGVADDARNNLSVHLKDAIKTLGSSKIDSLLFRGSWALIGWKGAPTGSVVEIVKPPLPPESVFIDSNFVSLSDSGSFKTNPIGLASRWKNITIEENIPGDALTSYKILGIRKTGERDTLRTLELTNGSEDISDISAVLYPQLVLVSKLSSSSDKQSPTIKKVAVDFDGVPELGLNYQVVNTSTDSVYQGDSISLDFSIYNVGESSADSFRVQVELTRPNNTNRSLLDTLLNNIDRDSYKRFQLLYSSNISDGDGDFKFKIIIDPTSNILEKYRDNNTYEKSFFVIEDTTITSINELSTTILADGIEIIDGDYVSSKPELTINIKYPIWFPISDTSSVSLFVDNIEIPVSNTQISFDTVNRIISYKLIPEFEDGDHSIMVIGKDKYGNLDYSSAVERYFTTTNELKLLDVYNYPNPFSNTTNFVFNLTQIPDELKIKIYSIAGRLIKEIKLISNELNAGFNKIYFDGKDEDGDLLANGVYIYKVITKKADETVTATNKMAIIK